VRAGLGPVAPGAPPRGTLRQKPSCFSAKGCAGELRYRRAQSRLPPTRRLSLRRTAGNTVEKLRLGLETDAQPRLRPGGSVDGRQLLLAPVRYAAAAGIHAAAKPVRDAELGRRNASWRGPVGLRQVSQSRSPRRGLRLDVVGRPSQAAISAERRNFCPCRSGERGCPGCCMPMQPADDGPG